MAKRSCDSCVRRKTRCDNSPPSCRKCLEAKPPLECTYLNPVLKRGPKTSRLRRRLIGGGDIGDGSLNRAPDRHPTPSFCQAPATKPYNRIPLVSSHSFPRRLPASIFTSTIEAYRSRMYPVWPVLDAFSLLTRLECSDRNEEVETEAYTLATALSAATIAQLKLVSTQNGMHKIDSAYMEKECSRIRSSYNYRERPSFEGVLTSFFLHVYHAKADNRNAAMVFLQEAISLARLLRLDDIGADINPTYCGFIDKAHQKLIYVLLWVSERGYAIQHSLPMSIRESIYIPSNHSNNFDIHGEGLIELANLFAVFDPFLHVHHHDLKTCPSPFDRQLLIAAHASLTESVPRMSNYDLVQRADYHFTKQWMRTLLWQRAMIRGLLSSASDDDSMSFNFPAQIAQNLLASISMMSKEELLSLGRDQLIKSFEVTNTLADVILCSYSTSDFIHCNFSPQSLSTFHSFYHLQGREHCRYGPVDFLHGLFQVISPFLEEDQILRDMLLQKTAEAFLRAPSRIVPGSIGGYTSEAEWTWEERVGERHLSNYNDYNYFLVEMFDDESSKLVTALSES